METVTVDGFDYTVSSKEAGDRLRADLAEGKGPMAETHAKNLAGRGAQAAADLARREPRQPPLDLVGPHGAALRILLEGRAHLPLLVPIIRAPPRSVDQR
mgnify:CR=1 FL=1